ncbi:hypothetical protein FRC12_013061 [Ceratobasidium sp. 428]|nr:hypothetical protein FRC12_013061 [Ceratobasidium sp. 428]
MKGGESLKLFFLMPSQPSELTPKGEAGRSASDGEQTWMGAGTTQRREGWGETGRDGQADGSAGDGGGRRRGPKEDIPEWGWLPIRRCAD